MSESSMSEHRKNALIYTALFMGSVVTIMSFFVADKTLFTALASLWVGSGGVGLAMSFYFGSSHKRGDVTNADK